MTAAEDALRSILLMQNAGAEAKMLARQALSPENWNRTQRADGTWASDDARLPAPEEVEAMDLDTIARRCARGVRGCTTDDQYVELIKRIVEALTAFRLAAPATGAGAWMPGQFRKKPVVIEAVQWTGDMGRIIAFVGHDLPTFGPPHDGALRIATLEGDHACLRGDWIIRGIKGELYPVKDPIFRETYEPVAPSSIPDTEGKP